MPVDDHGLNLVNEFITTNGIEKMSLAAKYDVAKNVMLDTLSGRLRTPQAHKIILKIIDDFKLRQKRVNMEKIGFEKTKTHQQIVDRPVEGLSKVFSNCI